MTRLNFWAKLVGASVLPDIVTTIPKVVTRPSPSQSPLTSPLTSDLCHVNYHTESLPGIKPPLTNEGTPLLITDALMTDFIMYTNIPSCLVLHNHRFVIRIDNLMIPSVIKKNLLGGIFFELNLVAPPIVKSNYQDDSFIMSKLHCVKKKISSFLYHILSHLYYRRSSFFSTYKINL